MILNLLTASNNVFCILSWFWSQNRTVWESLLFLFVFSFVYWIRYIGPALFIYSILDRWYLYLFIICCIRDAKLCKMADAIYRSSHKFTMRKEFTWILDEFNIHNRLNSMAWNSFNWEKQFKNYYYYYYYENQGISLSVQPSNNIIYLFILLESWIVRRILIRSGEYMYSEIENCSEWRTICSQWQNLPAVNRL